MRLSPYFRSPLFLLSGQRKVTLVIRLRMVFFLAHVEMRFSRSRQSLLKLPLSNSLNSFFQNQSCKMYCQNTCFHFHVYKIKLWLFVALFIEVLIAQMWEGKFKFSLCYMLPVGLLPNTTVCCFSCVPALPAWLLENSLSVFVCHIV